MRYAWCSNIIFWSDIVEISVLDDFLFLTLYRNGDSEFQSDAKCPTEIIKGGSQTYAVCIGLVAAF